MRLNPNMRTRQMPDKALISSILALLIFGWIMMLSASLAHFSSYSFFIKVDFPQPLAPIKPYLFPLWNLTEIFSKSGFSPNCMVTFAVDIIVNLNQ